MRRGKVRGFYTKDGKVRPITGKNPHVRPFHVGTSNLHIPRRTAKCLEAGRSKQARAVDESRKAPLTKDVGEWAKKPNRLDMKGVDYPEGHKEKVEKEKVKEKAKEPKPVKIGKKKKEHKGMTHLERLHLLSFAKTHEVDSQEIDSKVSYWENKAHLEELAKQKGVSEEQLHGSESKIEQDVSAHEEYLNNLKNELEEAGYKVELPEQ